MKKYYGSIDGLRMLACGGIIMMHMAANNRYEIAGFIYETVIPSFTNFVFLFMTISAFGMCCGYYEKMINHMVSFSNFYGKRFRKILPFFSVLVLLDVVRSPSGEAFYEAFADLTLLFGFLPDAGGISVIGVGWFLGLIFVFYLCFPFFCALLENKRRAWLSFGVSLIYHIACINYFEVGRTNILYNACFFLAGGLIYLYREEIERINPRMSAVVLAAAVVSYYGIGGNGLTSLAISTALLIYAIIRRESGVLANRTTRFLGGISMEMYLSHMVIFRGIERMGLNTVIGTGWLQYAVTVLLVICITIIFSVVLQRVLKLIAAKGKAKFA